jgi:hypothetical protein
MNSEPPRIFAFSPRLGKPGWRRGRLSSPHHVAFYEELRRQGFVEGQNLCLLPGTELSFAYEVRRSRLWPWSKNILHHKTAIFRQVNMDCPHAHHDALEFPDGEIVLLTYLMEGQQATVLQLPAAAVGSKAPERAVYV